MKTIGLLAILAAAQAAFGQLTTEQKLTDFRQIAGAMDKRYGPYEWKKKSVRYDVLDVKPWLDRVAQSKTDAEFFEICIDYLTRLHDANAQFFVLSTFEARLPITADFLEGAVRIVDVDRDALPEESFPFELGDEILSVDGMDAIQLADQLSRYYPVSNRRAARRVGAQLIADRPQLIMPALTQVADAATVVVRGYQTGAVNSYRIPWQKSGTPAKVGPVLTPKAAPARDYLAVLRELQSSRDPKPHADASGDLGPFAPWYSLPASFTQRLGTGPFDGMFSGTYRSGAHTIGFIRIPYIAVETGIELRQLESEIAYMQQNTEGLVVDVSQVQFGDFCQAEEMVGRLTPNAYETVTFQVRSTLDYVQRFESSVATAKAQGAPQSTIDQLQQILDALRAAYEQNRGLSTPVPLCGRTVTHAALADRAGAPIGYTKPLVLLVDELTLGPAESMAAMLQDSGRAVIFGIPTAGSGTNYTAIPVSAYSEGYMSISTMLAVRPSLVATSEYPTTNYIEDVGVRPDAYFDPWTAQVLLSDGVPYVDAFTAAVVNWIEGK